MISVVTYHVTVHTGDLYRSGTEANVHIKLIGKRGTTGTRHLRHVTSDNDKLFQEAQVGG